MDRVSALLRRRRPRGPRIEPRCSFCGKAKSQIGHLIAGPAKNGPQVFICDQCVALCGEIIQEGREPGQ
jgi:hypothetical protein